MFAKVWKGESAGSKIFAVALSVLLVFAFFPAPATTLAYAAGVSGGDNYGVKEATSYAGGEGTESSPYQISTAEELAYMAKQVNAGVDDAAYFQLTQDIDLSTVCNETAGSWTPIGNKDNWFKGVFDGAGKAIKNLYIGNDHEDTLYAGLFGYTRGGATFKNFSLTGSVTAESMSTAGVCGGAADATFEKIENKCTVVSSGNYVGGVTGMTTRVTLKQCANLASVTGPGGFFGGPNGLHGYSSDTMTCVNCYNAGAVTNTGSNASAYGVGSSIGTYDVTACFNVGNVTSAGDAYAFGTSGTSSFTASYYLASATAKGTSSSTDPTGLTKAETLSDISTAALNAASGEKEDVWTDGPDGYPVFVWQKTDAPSIVTQPVSADYTIGDNVTELSVSAKLPTAGNPGSDGVLSYQWYSNSVNSTKGGTAITDATSASYTPTLASEYNTTYYYCVVTNTYTGEDSKQVEATTTSNVAAITTLTTTQAAAPTINTQPQDMTIEQPGNSEKLSIEATVTGAGAGTLSYQWYKSTSTAAAPASDEAIEGATEATYEPSAEVVGDYYYYCVVTNTFEQKKTAQTVSSVATVKVVGVTIKDVKDLKNLATKVNAGTSYKGIQVNLAADLDLKDVTNWTPIGSFTNTSSNKPFSGTFNGNGHTISNLKIDSANPYVGLFGYVSGASISNLTLSGASVTTSTTNSSGAYAGIVAGYALNTTFEAIEASGEVSAQSGKYAGVVVGQATGAKFTNVVSNGSVTAKNEAGGIVGELKYSSSFESALVKCGNTATVKDNAAKASSYMGSVGGIVGYAYGNSYYKITIKQCYNKGAVSGKYGYAGGIAGGVAYTSVIACYNTGSVTDENTALGTKSSNTGGISGYVSSSTHKACYNTGTVSCATAGNSWYYLGAISGTSTTSNFGAGNYYLDSSCAMGGNGKTNYSTTESENITKLSVAQMKDPAFASTLNAVEGAEGIYAPGLGINQDTPAFASELPEGTPTVKTQVEDKWSLTGQTQVLEFEAQVPAEGVGSDGKVTYQWYSSDKDEFDKAITAIPNATTSSYKVDTTNARTKYYWCIATNTFDSGKTAVVPSAVAESIVSDSEPATPTLSIAGPTELQQTKEGTLTVTASYTQDKGQGDLSYKWHAYTKDELGGKTEVAIAEADKATVSIDTTAVRTIYYYCTVSNTYYGKTVSADSAEYEVTVTNFTIKTADDLAAFATLVDNGTSFKGSTVVLGADIDLSSVCSADKGSWNPIGEYATYSEKPFEGTFDGQGHIISGLYIAKGKTSSGLFACLKGATIKNLVVKGSVSAASGYAAGIAGAITGTAIFVNVGNEVDVTQETTSSWASQSQATGGFVGYAYSYATTFTGCYNKGKITSGSNCVGGFVGIQGYGSSAGTFTSCYNAGAVTSTCTYSSAATGGFIGANSGYSVSGKFINCYSAGKVTAAKTDYAGLFTSHIPDFTANGATNGINYYLSSAGNAVAPYFKTSTKVKGSATECTAANMKASDFVTTLNSYAADTWKTGSAVNQTRPALSWETGQVVNNLADAEIATIPAQTYTGTAITPTLSVTHNGDELVKDTDYTVTFANNVEVGTASATITGKSTSIYSGTKTVTFSIVKISIDDVAIAGVDNQTYTGSAITLSPVLTYNDATLVENSDYTLAYKDNTNVGTATITITGIGKYDGEKDVTFAINAAAITSVNIAEVDDQTYTGAAIEPELALTFNGTSLVKGTDYTLSYADNVNAGTATVTIAGTGNFSGEASASFTITPKQVWADVEWSGGTYGQSIAAPKVTFYGDADLTQEIAGDVEYDISYAGTLNNGSSYDDATKTPTKAGVYSASVKVRSDNYIAHDSEEFAGAVTDVMIKRASAGINAPASISKSYSDEDFSLDVKAATSASLSYTSSNESVAKVDSNGNVTIVGLGETTIAVSSRQTSNYLAGSAAITLKVDKATVSAKLSVPEALVYDGKTHEATAELSGVAKGDDVSVVLSYTDESGKEVKSSVTNAGTYLVKVASITGKDADGYVLSGDSSVKMVISPAEISSAKIAAVAGQVYTGSAIEPELALTFNDAALAKGTDYTLSYADNVNAGTATVAIAGTGNFTGKASASFKIVKELSNANVKVTLSKKSFAYNGKRKAATVKSVKLDGKALTAGTDYTVSSVKGKKVGTYKVTVTGKGDYVGEVTASFKIVPKKVTKLKVKPAKGKFKATWKRSSKQRSGVQVCYSLKKNMKKAKKVKVGKASAKAKTVKKLKSGKTYFVKVRAYKKVAGKTYYSAWSAKKVVKVK